MPLPIIHLIALGVSDMHAELVHVRGHRVRLGWFMTTNIPVASQPLLI